VSSLDRFEAYLETELAHLFGNILNGRLGLRRTHRAWPDIFGEMRDLPVRVIVSQSRIANRRELLQQLRR
jgi:hypothetical protein